MPPRTCRSTRQDDRSASGRMARSLSCRGSGTSSARNSSTMLHSSSAGASTVSMMSSTAGGSRSKPKRSFTHDRPAAHWRPCQISIWGVRRCSLHPWWTNGQIMSFMPSQRAWPRTWRKFAPGWHFELDIVRLRWPPSETASIRRSRSQLRCFRKPCRACWRTSLQHADSILAEGLDVFIEHRFA